jgi:hypothetical protein
VQLLSDHFVDFVDKTGTIQLRVVGCYGVATNANQPLRHMQIWDTTLFPRWQSLTCVVLNNCNLAVLPAMVGRLSNIRELHVAGNRLAQLPRELGQLRRLQLLQADDNLLTALPGAAAWTLQC